MSCRTPSEAAYIPPARMQLTDIGDYREEVTLVLSSVRENAAKSIHRGGGSNFKLVRQNL